MFFSEDLYEVIKICLNTNQKFRPTACELLAHPIVQSKFKFTKLDLLDDQTNINTILKTIKFEKLIGKLKINLPNRKHYRGNSDDLMTMSKYKARNCNGLHRFNDSAIKLDKVIKLPNYQNKEEKQISENNQKKQVNIFQEKIQQKKIKEKEVAMKEK